MTPNLWLLHSGNTMRASCAAAGDNATCLHAGSMHRATPRHTAGRTLWVPRLCSHVHQRDRKRAVVSWRRGMVWHSQRRGPALGLAPSKCSLLYTMASFPSNLTRRTLLRSRTPRYPRHPASLLSFYLLSRLEPSI